MGESDTRRAYLVKASRFALLGPSAVLSAVAPTSPIPIRIANAAGGLNLTMAMLMR